MNDLLFGITIISSILWSVGFFAFNAGDGIHLLLGIAVITILAQIKRRRRSFSYINKTLKF